MPLNVTRWPFKGIVGAIVAFLRIRIVITDGSFTYPSSIGAGGIELVPFYEYGGSLGPMPIGANWSTFNFGTAPFRNIFSAAFAAHEQHGLVMDFAPGPSQGQGFSARADDPGLQWDLNTWGTNPSAKRARTNLEFNGIVDNSIFGQGSYVVDHFDQKGAKVSIKFWEEYVLDDQLRELLKKVGHDGWEDSPEFESNVTWSRSIPSRFEKYFRTLRKWINAELDLELSVQPGYGLPVNVQETVPEIDAPECESLNFEDRIDSYRQFVGPANLAGKRIISNELGAVLGSSFYYRLPELLFSANRGFAAGVNQYILHLQSFSGNYYQTTWHSHTPFNYLFTEPWSPRQPVWDHGLKELVDYISRIRHIQQSGSPKADGEFTTKSLRGLLEPYMNLLT
ncbi:hypothetical protein ANO14919_132600 [Xylariales sp. No.14919]|nr:hypothetical protein ANO14919_132600 [Xylariales sp. No.14919]